MKRVGAAIAVSVVAFALGACGVNQAGAAAVVGTNTISDGLLTEEVNQVSEALNLDPNDAVNRVLLQRLVLEEIVDQIASNNDVAPNEGEIQAFIDERVEAAGGQEQFENSMIQNGVPTQSIHDAVKMTLQLEGLGEKLAPGKSDQEQQMAVTMAAVELAESDGIKISPRFGTWDPSTLQIAPPANELSQPAPIDAPSIDQIPDGQS